MLGVAIVAAGSSTRFGAGAQKVLAPLLGVPVLVRAARPFREVAADAAIVVAVRAQDVADARAAFAAEPTLRGVVVVEGGSTRQRSVAAALAALPADADPIVVHDGARPLVTPDLVRRVLAAIERTRGPVVPGLAPAESVHVADRAGALVEALPRERLRAVQTPQGAPGDALRRRVARALAEGREATDEAGLFLAGDGSVPVACVEGDPENVKITTRRDLEHAAAILRDRTAE